MLNDSNQIESHFHILDSATAMTIAMFFFFSLHPQYEV